MYSTGQAAKLLGIEFWKIQHFVDHPHFKIKADFLNGGGGKGSRRVFCKKTLYEIAILNDFWELGLKAEKCAIFTELALMFPKKIFVTTNGNGKVELDVPTIISKVDKNLAALKILGREYVRVEEEK